MRADEGKETSLRPPQAKLPDHRVPTSPHYYGAVVILDWMEAVSFQSEDWRYDQAERVKQSLRYAWCEEGGKDAAISAYIQAEMGRVELVAGNPELARRFFERAKENFTCAGLGEKAAQLEDLLVRIATLLLVERERNASGCDEGRER